MLKRLPTHIADIRENPRWLPMFALGRVMVYRKPGMEGDVVSRAHRRQ
jgi:hypothetical protein